MYIGTTVAAIFGLFIATALASTHVSSRHHVGLEDQYRPTVKKLYSQGDPQASKRNTHELGMTDRSVTSSPDGSGLRKRAVSKLLAAPDKIYGGDYDHVLKNELNRREVLSKRYLIRRSPASPPASPSGADSSLFSQASTRSTSMSMSSTDEVRHVGKNGVKGSNDRSINVDVIHSGLAIFLWGDGFVTGAHMTYGKIEEQLRYAIITAQERGRVVTMIVIYNEDNANGMKAVNQALGIIRGIGNLPLPIARSFPDPAPGWHEFTATPANPGQVIEDHQVMRRDTDDLQMRDRTCSAGKKSSKRFLIRRSSSSSSIPHSVSPLASTPHSSGPLASRTDSGELHPTSGHSSGSDHSLGSTATSRNVGMDRAKSSSERGIGIIGVQGCLGIFFWSGGFVTGAHVAYPHIVRKVKLAASMAQRHGTITAIVIYRETERSGEESLAEALEALSSMGPLLPTPDVRTYPHTNEGYHVLTATPNNPGQARLRHELRRRGIQHFQKVTQNSFH